ncbi:hypothetical protein QF042_001880 [Pedobacter sp. W3I1]|uniref:hypothetical protein n=1 Tax=Pedobacter sp. W3I1 TaxID=3042291 RepID=UPI00278B9ABC|nr:hypothetical protein [Pedobacter sp. W3I1]MDQ0638315.1 hypothetical protein [Pedobacter sp. W3I1]
MIKLIVSLIFCGVVTSGFAQTFYSGNNQIAVTIDANDNFSFAGKTVAHYGLGWYSEQSNVPPSAFISGFAGIRLFTGGQSRLLIDGNGLVGIGTNTPLGKLDVRGTTFIGTNDLVLGSTGSFIQIDQGSVTGNSYTQLRAFSNGGALTNNLILQNSGGNVGIGTTNPTDMLTVAGKIGAREIKVATNAGADFVFEQGYKLPELAELEKFVKINKHLPEIPTAKQMVENGVDLGELNIKLLQKVEELTLHLIEKDKELKAQQLIINSYGERLHNLEHSFKTKKSIHIKNKL